MSRSGRIRRDHYLDELDIKIFRALISESIIAPSNTEVMSSLRDIARKLGSDDMTIRNRYKKLQEAGCMSVWRLGVNPSVVGYKPIDIVLEVQPESAKADMIRKLRLIHGIIRIVDYYGPTLQVLLLYDRADSCSRTVELISRITNAERVTLFRQSFPLSETKRLTETDLSIVRALSMDARKSYVLLSKELGFSTRTVKNRIEKLRKEKTLFSIPELKMGDIPGIIPVTLHYSYASSEVKDSVDRSILSHFDDSYLWGLSDSEQAFLVLSLSTMADVQRSRDWAKEQPGVARAELDIQVNCTLFPEKIAEILTGRTPEQLGLAKNLQGS